MVVLMLPVPVAAHVIEMGLPTARAALVQTGAERIGVAFAAVREVGASLILRLLGRTEG